MTAIELIRKYNEQKPKGNTLLNSFGNGYTVSIMQYSIDDRSEIDPIVVNLKTVQVEAEIARMESDLAIVKNFVAECKTIGETE